MNVNDLNDIKVEISNRTNIPLEMIVGSSVEEVMSYTKALLDYRKEVQANREKSKEERFSYYMFGEETKAENSDMDALIELQIELGLRNSYPVVHDGGQIDFSQMPDSRDTKEQFESWMSDQLAFNPRKENGWIKL